jgi:lipoprotein-anchoring transpeptidase ErfK/SrfK
MAWTIRHWSGKARTRIGLQVFTSTGLPLRGATALFFALTTVIASTCNVQPVFANVLISVDKSTQVMSVSVNGVARYQFAVSTGRAGYSTPIGTYHPQRLERTWFSRLYYNSPMPHSIFFHGGYAIHGSYEINRLGGPASHGCIRLHPSNAATLFALVESEGRAATTIVVSGSNPGVAQSPAPIGRTDGGLTRPAYEQPYTPYYRQSPPGYPPPTPSIFPFFNSR